MNSQFPAGLGGGIPAALQSVLEALSEDGFRLSMQAANGFPEAVPLLIKTSAGSSKSDSFGWNQSFDAATQDAGPAIEDLLDTMATDFALTGHTLLVGPGVWNVSTPAAPGEAIRLRTRQLIKGTTGHRANCQIIRDKDLAAHLVTIDTGSQNGFDENINSGVCDITLLGANNKGSVDPIYDIIHIEKPFTGNWGDLKSRIVNVHLEGALRHNIYYSGRGDPELAMWFLGRCGDSSFKIESAADVYQNMAVVSSAGRHALEVKDATDIHVNDYHGYFPGSNMMNIWDGSGADSVRENGAGLRIQNSNAVKFDRGRIEDTTGAGMVLVGGTGIKIDTYFNNNGTVGSYAQAVAGTKDYGVNNISATVAGVPLIYMTRSGSGRPNREVSIKAGVRQARSTQQISHLVYIDPPNNVYRPFQNIDIDLFPWIAGDEGNEKPLDDVAAWTDAGRTNYWEDTFGAANKSEPMWFINTRMQWRGMPMKAFHERVQNNRIERHNIWDQTKYYELDDAEVTANVTATAWSTNSNWTRCTLTVDADLRGTLNKKTGVYLNVTDEPLLQGYFNIVSVTDTTVIVAVREDRSEFTDPADDPVASGTIAGTAVCLTLDDTVPGWTYCVSVTSMDASARDMIVRLKEPNGSSSDVTISAVGDHYFKYLPETGWVDVT